MPTNEAWLLVMIADDEQAIRANYELVDGLLITGRTLDEVAGVVEPYYSRFRPQRMLREIRMMRRILDIHCLALDGKHCRGCLTEVPFDRCPERQAIAEVYR